MLENPPLLITSDTKRIEIHTNFTNTVKNVYTLELSDLEEAGKRELLRAAFREPEKLRPGTTRHQVTKEAAESFSQLAHHLQSRGYEPQRVAHFLNRIIFCMFAEDVGLLPNRIFSKLATASVAHPESFEANAKQLFGGMSKGGAVAFEVIDWFDGGLFDDDTTLPLDKTELQLVLKCAELDWSNIEPSIFGTLFERGLDPDKRSQQGTHYTDPDTIMKIVGPVVLEPWAREWETEKEAIAKQVNRAKRTVSEAAKQRYFAFLERLANFKVLDPACGSGNFLYLALRGLKTLEKRVIHDAEALGLPPQFPRVGPEAVLGIEVNPYAAELARVTIWIGEIQWMIENGFSASRNPILKPLDQIACRDAILNEDGTEPEWPKAHVIVGNPPFLGVSRKRRELGDKYVNALDRLYAPNVPRGADLVCYWFNKAEREVRLGHVQQAGLVATNSIRGGANRKVLERIIETSHIFCAWSDEPWINEGAAVRVSMICFGGNSEARLNGQLVGAIRADLTAPLIGGQAVDLTRARQLAENAGVSFQGASKKAKFEIPASLARSWLQLPNPNGRPNSDVLKPWANGFALSRRADEQWIIDFGTSLSETEASLYEAPFQYLLEHVRPTRITNNREAYRRFWWRFAEPRPGLRRALIGRDRYIATIAHSKFRLFVWLPATTSPDQALITIARDDDTAFGVLQSRFHELWALRLGTSLEDRPRYTPTTTFETFPFPEGLTPNIPADEYAGDPRAKRIAAAAKALDELRESWLNPPELVNWIPEVVPGYPDRLLPKNVSAEKELKKRTLTNLYNTNPAWLLHAHRELDEAVAAAYGWPWPLADEDVLQRLYKLNQERAAQRKDDGGPAVSAKAARKRRSPGADRLL